MPQINLLKQTGGGNKYQFLTPKILVWVFFVALILLAGYYGFIVYQGQQYQKDIADEQSKISAVVEEANKVSNRSELLIRQQQLQSLTGLIQNHVFWSQIFSALAHVTLNSANYTSLLVNSADKSLSLNATVPSLEDLDKYLQVFDQPAVAKNFNNVRIGGFTKIQSKNSTLIQFQVKMDFNPSIIQYNKSN